MQSITSELGGIQQRFNSSPAGHKKARNQKISSPYKLLTGTERGRKIKLELRSAFMSMLRFHL